MPYSFCAAFSIPTSPLFAMDYKKILLLSFGHLSCDLNSHALPALLPYLAAAHGFDYQTCGLLAFAYSAIASLIQPALGFLADKITKGWFIPLGILMAGIGIGLTGFLSQEYAILAALILGGAGAAVFHPEAARYANLVSGGHKGTGLSIFAVGGNAGMLAGPLFVMLAVGGIPMGAFTFGGFGLHGTALFILLGMASGAILFLCIRSWNISIQKPSETAAVSSASNDWGAFGILCLCMLSRMGLTIAFTTYLPLYWQGVFHTSASTANLMLVLFSVCGVICNLSGGAAADRWGFCRVIRCSSFMTLPFLCAFPLIQTPWLAGLLFLPLAIGLFAPYSAMVVLGQRYLSKNVGFASGITLGVAVSVGGMFAPVIGYAADMWNSLSSAMFLLVPLAAVGAICSCFLKQPKKSQVLPHKA